MIYLTKIYKNYKYIMYKDLIPLLDKTPRNQTVNFGIKEPKGKAPNNLQETQPSKPLPNLPNPKKKNPYFPLFYPKKAIIFY